MTSEKTKKGGAHLDAVVAQAREAQRSGKNLRERAMKLFPPVCARCGREFSGKKLRELTVHHRDHNHDYNPPDGALGLLCIYCHENEHSRYLEQAAHGGSPDTGGEPDSSSSGFRPFAGLEAL